MTEQPDNPVQSLWQGQPVEGTKMSLEALRNRTGKFQKKIMWRNVREYISSLVGALLFAYFFATTHEVMFRVAYVCFILGLGWVVIQLHRKGAVRTPPAVMGSSTCLAFFRSELVRQRDVVRNVWSWYLAPLVPGFVALTIASLLRRPNPRGLLTAVLIDASVTVLFFAVWKMNMRAARCLQRLIDELPSVG